MLKAICRISIALMLVSVFFPRNGDAQIAPTNTATISGSLSDSTGKPVANAKVSLSGPRTASTQTDTQGLFVFVGVPLGTYQISAAAASLGTATRSISVTGDTNVAIHYEPASQNGLKVIAQVSSSANAEFNVTPASVTQVNPIANAFEGKTSWRTILEQIPGVAQAGLGNGNGSFAALPDSPMVPMQISINGALPYETATLLDGMPLIGSAFNGGAAPISAGAGTSLNLYPLDGFDSADVVRGPGANAPSIVDSIGGSFVLNAPGTITNNHYDLSISTDPYGGIVTNALAAVRWKKLSVVATYGVNDSPGPFNGANFDGVGNLFSQPSMVNGLPFSAYSPPCSSPCEFGQYLVSPNFTNFPQYGYQTGLIECCVNVSTAWSQHSGSVALTYVVSPSVSAGFFYAGQRSPTLFPEAFNTDNFVPPAGYTGGIPAGQFLCNNIASFLTSTPVQQGSSLLEEKITAQLGRGVLHLAALQNRTFQSLNYNVPNSQTAQLYGGGTWNGTPTIFTGGTYNLTYPDSYRLSQSSNGNNRDFLVSYATPLGDKFHIGASFVQSYYDAPRLTSINADFNGFLLAINCIIPAAISQTTRELRFFIGGNPSEKTSLDLSGYFVNAGYHVQDPNDPTGNTYVDEQYSYAAPRLGFVWRPTAAVAVRASAGGGLAEAPLNDLVGSNQICNLGSFYEEFKTNINLQPEKSFGFDFGADIRLHRNTVLSFDVYHTNLYGQLYQSTSLTGTYLGLPLYTVQYGNLGESRYEGVLLDLRHDVPHGLYWSLSGGLTRGYVVNLPAGFYDDPTVPCTNCINLTVVPNINFNGTFAASVPYAQGLGTLGYRWNGNKYIDLVGTYYGNNNTYFHPSFVEFDGHVRYPLSRNVSLLATFRNITGIYDGPAQVLSPANFSGAPTIGGLPYPLYSEQYGPRTVILTMMLHK